jgi:hypothetical protein
LRLLIGMRREFVAEVSAREVEEGDPAFELHPAAINAARAATRYLVILLRSA